MIVAPAVDLKGGRCVQLVGGRPEDERVSLPDPVSVAAGWVERGFGTIHVVDLDAALGSGSNESIIRTLAAETDATLQVGGGIRSDQAADALLEGGVSRIVVGTRAIDDPHWLSRLARRWEGRVVLALDTRDGLVLRKGWTEATSLYVEEYLPELADLPLAGVLSTDVGREGRLEGIDRGGCRRIIDVSPHPVWISGGVTTTSEIEWLETAGAAGVVLGMAIYTESVDPTTIARRWGGLHTTSTGGDA